MENAEDLDSLTDEVLFNRFKNGDGLAFNAILKRFKGPLFSFLINKTRNQAEADDLFQEVFFKVVDKRDSFRTDVSFKAWLFTVARNTMIDSFRKKKRRPEPESMDAESENDRPLSEKIANDRALADDLMVFAEQDGFLDEALKKLPDEQKETFFMKVKGDLTFEEIAEVMKCSVNTAKSRMRYALDDLRAIFVKRGYLK